MRRADAIIFSSVGSAGDGLASSRLTALATARTQPPSCSRTIIAHRWPGSRTSWQTSESGLSSLTRPAASAYSRCSISISSSHFASPRSRSSRCCRWMKTCRRSSNAPTCSSDSQGGRRSIARNWRPRKPRQCFRVASGCPKSSRFSRSASRTRSATKESSPLPPVARSYTSRSEHSRSARSTSTTGRKNSFLLIVMRSRAEPDESRWSPTVSEHWSELAQRMTVAYGVKSGPRLRKEGRTMPVTWLRRGTISSRIARSLPFEMKYPPSSCRSSRRWTSCGAESECRWHAHERTITGSWPTARSKSSGGPSSTE
mmetsp:Transcript_17296/g.52511  ORF Transcript_17296/g.52511 Transcript_17296/m.52511 type:complete len:314 (+) Transcript_17296:611-1552(+)